MFVCFVFFYLLFGVIHDFSKETKQVSLNWFFFLEEEIPHYVYVWAELCANKKKERSQNSVIQGVNQLD